MATSDKEGEKKETFVMTSEIYNSDDCGTHVHLVIDITGNILIWEK